MLLSVRKILDRFEMYTIELDISGQLSENPPTGL